MYIYNEEISVVVVCKQVFSSKSFGSSDQAEPCTIIPYYYLFIYLFSQSSLEYIIIGD